MKVFDLSDDILEMIKDFVFEYRSKKVLEEFNHEWGVRRPYLKLFQIGRKLNVGRLFLNKDTRKMHIISFPEKYYISGVPLRSILDFRYHHVYEPYRWGLIIDVKNTKVQSMINEICQKNDWDDLPQNATICSYLLKKEEGREW